MLKRFFPDKYVESIFEIDSDELLKKGINGIIFDIDNTLVPYDIEGPSGEIINLFEQLQAKGFKICLFSNNTKERVFLFNEKLKLPAIYKANKPLISKFKKAMNLLGTDKTSTVIVGDQIFTDVYGGNRAGVTTILVAPVSDKDEWITKIKRGLERKIVKAYEKTLQDK